MRTGNENEESRLFAVSSQAVKCGGRSVRASRAQVKREPWPVWGTLEEEWCEGSAAARNPKARPLAAATNGRSALPPCRACIRPKYRCTTALVDNQHRTNLVRSSLTFHQLVTRSAHEIITNNRNTISTHSTLREHPGSTTIWLHNRSIRRHWTNCKERSTS